MSAGETQHHPPPGPPGPREAGETLEAASQVSTSKSKAEANTQLEEGVQRGIMHGPSETMSC